MAKDLIINSSLIISFLFIAGQLFKNNIVCPTANIKLKVMVGIIGGVFGSFLMFFSIRVSDIMIVDMRNIALIFATIYGGWVPSFICVFIMAITRIGIFGYNFASITAVIVFVILSIACIIILKLKTYSTKQKYWMMVFFSIFLTLVGFFNLIDEKETLMELSLSYVLIILGDAYFSYVVFTYIERSNELFRRYKEESRKDFLTGLFNYRQFDELFNNQVKIINEGNEQLSVLAIDIDYFKKVNDTFGHSEGDIILQKFGIILKNSTRSFDIVFRCGGDEFTVLLLDCPHQKALEIAERIRFTVENEIFLISKGTKLNITISIGVASFPETTQDINGILKQADNALYEAKRTGRNRVCSAS